MKKRSVRVENILKVKRKKKLNSKISETSKMFGFREKQIRYQNEKKYFNYNLLRKRENVRYFSGQNVENERF
jgi:hypothetical protein